MEKNEFFVQKVEKLEKELWDLAKNGMLEIESKVLQSVQDKLEQIKTQLENFNTTFEQLESSLEQIQADVEQLKTDKGQTEQKLNQINQKLESLSTDIVDVQTQQGALKEDLSDCQTEISLLNEKSTTNSQNISALQSWKNAQDGVISDLQTWRTAEDKTVADLKTNVADVTKQTESILGSLSSLSGEIDDVKQKNTTQDGQISTLSQSSVTQGGQLANLESKVGQYENQASEILATITELTSRIAKLENNPSGGGGGRTVDVIFDMTSPDESLNLGQTSGMHGNNFINWTDDYDFLRIYGSMNNMLGYAEVPLKNLYKNEFLLHNIASAGKIEHFFKITILTEQKRIFVGKGVTWTMTTSTGLMSMNTGYLENYYITRVEGVKGQ